MRNLDRMRELILESEPWVELQNSHHLRNRSFNISFPVCDQEDSRRH